MGCSMDRSTEVHLDRSMETKVAAAATKENKYFGFVRSPNLFVCKVKAAATMTRQPRLRRISTLASFICLFVRSFVCLFLRPFVHLFIRSFIHSFFNARDPLFWVANFWLCWEILESLKN